MLSLSIRNPLTKNHKQSVSAATGIVYSTFKVILEAAKKEVSNG